MAITYLEEFRIFHLDTQRTSYVIGIADHENFIGHVYYGKRVSTGNLQYLMRIYEAPFIPSENNRDRTSFLDSFPMEYPGNGLGDYRESAIEVRTAGGHRAVSLGYRSYEIINEKPELDGLPSTFSGNEQTQTLILHCCDPVLELWVDLIYTVFETEDVITRSVKVRNNAPEAIYLEKLFSCSLDMDDRAYEMMILHGSWARERHVERRSIGYGKQSVCSIRGESSHQEHPFVAVLDKTATQEYGSVYGLHFVYSGNFFAQVEKNQFDMLRLSMGIHPDQFCWELKQGDLFCSPEVVLTYSSEGVGRMTRNYHDMYRNHLIRGRYKDKKRPILINNWEATYFDFTTEKLLQIAKESAALGIEMLVMDDGWFGHRNDDNTSLGDWYVNETKITGGLRYLVHEVNRMGLKFGIWFEPEMISPDSTLYDMHADWAIQIPGRVGSLARNQYVLDLSRSEVREYVYDSLVKVLREANIEYIKWDMNRQLSDLGSSALCPERQGELLHRYVLGVYELQDRLVREFPNILLENCSGGGARFDPGMLYYSPQIWCSDDTDAIERLRIQEGTALLYPLSAIGAHISDCPNHTVGRFTPFETRGFVALAGTFGYELDVTKLAATEKAMIPGQIAMYHKFNDLIRNGDYYRIASFHENKEYDCYMTVSKDKSEALITFIQVLNRANAHSRNLRLKGLSDKWNYQICYENRGESQVTG
ncbi:MAG: alpha-galactosidase, partial [Lachnospiraceae bacterium]